MPRRVAIEPGLVLALAKLLRIQAAAANEAANTSAQVASAVGLVSRASAELDGVASIWRSLGATLEARALLAAGFTLNLPAANIGFVPATAADRSSPSSYRSSLDPLRQLATRAIHDALTRALLDGLTRSAVSSLVESFEQLTDRELRSMWVALTVEQKAALLNALLADGHAEVAKRLALISAPTTDSRFRLDGVDLLQQVAQWLPLLEFVSGASLDGVLSYDELVLAAAARTAVLPEWLAFAAATLASSPAMFNAVAWSRKGLQDPSARPRDGPLAGLFEVRDTVTVDDINEAVVQIGIVKLLADPATFDRLDAAKTGTVNGHISIEDVEIAIANSWFSSDQTELLQHLTIPGVFSRMGSTDDRAKGTQLSRGSMYWTDVASLAINLHAFTATPDEALQFLDWLPKPYDDPTGQTRGLDIRLSSDDGVQALASSALAATQDILAQTLVVAALPESEGGERNRLITLYYSELGLQMNSVLNRRFVDAPMDPTSPGHSGANWMLLAPWASNSIRPALRGDPVEVRNFPDLTPSTGDRQQLADGNQMIFGDLAPRYAAFIAAANDGVFDDPDSFVDFFTSSTLPNGRPMFESGHNQLRDGIVYLGAAVLEADPIERQRLTYVANTLLATHEQAAVQPLIAALTDLGVGDDGIYRGIGGEILSYVGGGDAVLATGLMTMSIGRPDRSGTIELRLSNDLNVDDFANTNNLILNTSLTTTLDPGERKVIEAQDSRLHLRGDSAPVSLPDLGGWDDPPSANHRDPFPTSAKTWYDIGTSNVIILPAGEPPVFVTESRGTPDGKDLAGTGAVDWGDPDDRMWYIANLFQQIHTDPRLWDLQRQVGLGRVDDGIAAFGFLPPAARREFGRSNSRSPRD